MDQTEGRDPKFRHARPVRLVGLALGPRAAVGAATWTLHTMGPDFCLTTLLTRRKTKGGKSVSQKSRNVGRTHDVIDNKGSVFGEPTMSMKTRRLSEKCHDVYDSKEDRWHPTAVWDATALPFDQKMQKNGAGLTVRSSSDLQMLKNDGRSLRLL